MSTKERPAAPHPASAMLNEHASVRLVLTLPPSDNLGARRPR